LVSVVGVTDHVRLSLSYEHYDAQRLAAGQAELDLGLEATAPIRRGGGGESLPITSSLMGHLLSTTLGALRRFG
jgi:hypothetical protein